VKRRISIRKGGNKMLHLVLDLDTDQIKELKRLAIDKDMTVKALVTQLTMKAIANKNNKNIKE
jgi:hypothetical protein